jgi:hypothetical protein
MIKALALVTLLTFASAAIKDCGSDTALFKITELTQDPPSSVATGQNLSLTLKYTVPEKVIGGRSITSITYNYLPFKPTEEDLCINTECPITPGEHDGSTWYEWPSGLSGVVVSKVEWHDLSNNLLLCIESKLTATGMKNTNQSGQLAKYLRNV